MPLPSLDPTNGIASRPITQSQIEKSMSQAHARGTGPAGVSSSLMPSGVVNDRRPSSKRCFHDGYRYRHGNCQLRAVLDRIDSIFPSNHALSNAFQYARVERTSQRFLTSTTLVPAIRS